MFTNKIFCNIYQNRVLLNRILLNRVLLNRIVSNKLSSNRQLSNIISNIISDVGYYKKKKIIISLIKL